MELAAIKIKHAGKTQTLTFESLPLRIEVLVRDEGELFRGCEVDIVNADTGDDFTDLTVADPTGATVLALVADPNHVITDADIEERRARNA